MLRRVASVIDWVRRLDFMVRWIPTGVAIVSAVIAYLGFFAQVLPPVASIAAAAGAGLVSGGIILAASLRLRPSLHTPVLPSLPPPIRKERQREVLHDGVLWTDDGGRAVDVTGPLCPIDKTPLHYASSQSRSRSDERPHWSDHVSDYHGALFCPECRERYYLTRDRSAKTVGASKDEVESRFAGIRRRYASEQP